MIKFIKEYKVELILLAIVGTVLAIFLAGCGGTRAVTTVTHHKSSSSLSVEMNWLVALSIVGIGASVAAAIFLPVKALATSTAAGFGAILLMALLVTTIQPYLPWIALGLGVCAVATAIWYFKKYVTATASAVQFGTEVAALVPPAAVAPLKEVHAALQSELGVKGIIDSTIAAAKIVTP